MQRTGSKPTDELIRLAIIGDGSAFTALWDNNVASLKLYIKSLTKTLDDFYIDDICSRSFEKAFRQIRNFDPSKSQFTTWLKTIAHNTTLDVLESEHRSSRDTLSLDNGGKTATITEAIPDQLDTPLDSMIRDEDEEQTEAYINGLSEIYRDVARKRLIDGLQYEEIAEELGINLNTVRTRIKRAKELIEKMKNEQDS